MARLAGNRRRGGNPSLIPRPAAAGNDEARAGRATEAAPRGWVMDRVIGRRLFTDGLERDVYEDAAGRQ
jgi:hypothetical protein